MNQPSTKPRRRLSPESRKLEIIAASRQVLSSRGYWGFTFAEVAQLCGVTLQTVAHYFPTKDDLLLSVLAASDREDQLIFSGSDGSTPNAHVFIDLTRRLIISNSQKPEITRLYALLEAESLDSNHPAHLFFLQRTETALEAVKALVSGWHSAPLELAHHVVALLDGLQLQWLRDQNFDMAASWDSWAEKYFGD